MDSIGPKLNLQMVDAPAAGLTRADIEALRVRVAGDVVAPGDPEWDDARQAWNLAVDQWPAAVALPENAQDVAEVVALAAEAGVQVAPQGTGHNAAALGSLDRVARVVKLGAFVCSAPSFTDQPKVANGASELMVDVFGDRGRHARSAVGVPVLPLGAVVEIDAIFAIGPA